MKAAIFPVLLMRSTSDAVKASSILSLFLCELIVGGVDEPEHLLRLEARGVVLLGHEQAEEHRVEAALFRASQVELPVVDALAHVAAVVELAIDDVDVGVEDERRPDGASWRDRTPDPAPVLPRCGLHQEHTSTRGMPD